MNLRETEAQRLGRNKRTKVVQSVIDEGEYRRKFDLITSNKEINRLLYHCAKKMLDHRKGTLYEDMYWIDPNTEKIVAAELTQTVEKAYHIPEEQRRLYARIKD